MLKYRIIAGILVLVFVLSGVYVKPAAQLKKQGRAATGQIVFASDELEIWDLQTEELGSEEGPEEEEIVDEAPSEEEFDDSDEEASEDEEKEDEESTAEEEAEPEETEFLLETLMAEEPDQVFTSISQLGPITHYNGIIFGDLEAQQADVEGALAVGGKAKIATVLSFDFGAAVTDAYNIVGVYENPNSYPTLLLGETPTLGRTSSGAVSGGGSTIYGGPVVIPESDWSKYLENDTRFSMYNSDAYMAVAEKSLIQSFFSQTRTTVTNTSKLLTKANNLNVNAEDFILNWSNPKTQEMNQWSDEKIAAYEAIDLNTGGLKVLSFNIVDSGNLTVKGPYLSSKFGAYDVIVFNFPNISSATFDSEGIFIDGKQIDSTAVLDSQMMYLVGLYAEKIVWNFPNAAEINLKNAGVIGSVIAPKAKVHGVGGSINGMLIANTYTATEGTELHAFRLTNKVFDFKPIKEPIGEILLIKTDAEGKKLLANAKFILYYIGQRDTPYYAADRQASTWTTKESEAYQYITDKNGQFSVKGLSFGTYYLREMEAPQGYLVEKEVTKVTVDAEEKKEVLVTNAPNPSEPTGSILLYKLDANDQKTLLDGAKFLFYFIREETKYYYQLDAGAPLWTTVLEDADQLETKDGSLYLSNLPYGTYYLEEVAAPEGYILSTETTRVQVHAATTKEVQIFNVPEEPLGGIVLSKIDGDDKRTFLDGAEFLLYFVSGETRYYYQIHNGAVAWTTDSEKADRIATEDGKVTISDLPYETYYIEETTAPNGYVIQSEPKMVTVDGKIHEEVVFYNEKQQGKIKIEKVDATDNEKHLDATFILYYMEEDAPYYYMSSGSEIKWVTDRTQAELLRTESGILEISSLPHGMYYLEETEAPLGYQLAKTALEIPVNTNLQLEFQFENHVENPSNPKGAVKVIKTDEGNPEIYLDHAKFILYYIDEGQYHYYMQSGWTTEEEDAYPFETIEGTFTIENLEYGIYYLKEVKAPDGYEINVNDLELIVAAETLQEKEITNAKIQEIPTGGIQIKKVDADHRQTELNGAAFLLYFIADETTFYYYLIEEDVWWTEDRQLAETLVTKEGVIRVSGLPYNTYYLEEIKAPEGYQITDKTTEIRINGAQEVQIEITNQQQKTEEKGSLKVIKVDQEDANRLLDDAQFLLYFLVDEIPFYYSLEDGKISWTSEKWEAEVLVTKDGTFTVTDLPLGKYFLEEIKAPAGYLRNMAVIEFSLTKEIEKFEYIVKNTKKSTGGGGHGSKKPKNHPKEETSVEATNEESVRIEEVLERSWNEIDITPDVLDQTPHTGDLRSGLVVISAIVIAVGALLRLLFQKRCK